MFRLKNVSVKAAVVVHLQAGGNNGPMGGVGSAPEDNFSYFYGQQHGGQKRRVGPWQPDS